MCSPSSYLNASVALKRVCVRLRERGMSVSRLGRGRVVVSDILDCRTSGRGRRLIATSRRRRAARGRGEYAPGSVSRRGLVSHFQEFNVGFAVDFDLGILVIDSSSMDGTDCAILLARREHCAGYVFLVYVINWFHL